MLVLARKPNEEIHFSSKSDPGKGIICLKIIEVVGNKVRLGIEAPDDILILRKELADKNIEFVRKKEQKPDSTNMI